MWTPGHYTSAGHAELYAEESPGVKICPQLHLHKFHCIKYTSAYSTVLYTPFIQIFLQAPRLSVLFIFLCRRLCSILLPLSLPTYHYFPVTSLLLLSISASLFLIPFLYLSLHFPSSLSISLPLCQYLPPSLTPFLYLSQHITTFLSLLFLYVNTASLARERRGVREDDEETRSNSQRR
jgi:hypothetical protein